ncbi:WbqC family protein [Streptomyces sp. WAC01280]|uniref:WbqC family protein n=1 Tax=Streptomyces sp. WAC01280 TaxID=2487424 RepID=UPI0021AE69C5|nr:WbqC family protein [Streptomyces sp. WAC01280]
MAIHHLNLFPRLSTLAKLFAADCWLVLDDVQLARRDFQHRARLAAMSCPAQRQWLSLPTHLPQWAVDLDQRRGSCGPRTIPPTRRRYAARARGA